MRFLVATAALAVSLPAFSQSGGGAWYLDVHRVGPTLTGHFQGTQDGQPVHFDLAADLGLAKDTTVVGGSLDNQGPRFGLELSVEGQNYSGRNVLTEPVTISGTTYEAQGLVTTSLKTVTYTGNWTIRFVRSPGPWIGLDLGVRATTLDLDALGDTYLTGSASAHFKAPLPMPQVGPSVGLNVLDGRLVARAFYHYLAYKGAMYYHAGADVRIFPWKWLGVRAFYDDESWKVPENTLSKDLDIGLDRKGAGFGSCSGSRT